MAHKLGHSNRVKDWWTPNKDLVDSEKRLVDSEQRLVDSGQRLGGLRTKPSA